MSNTLIVREINYFSGVKKKQLNLIFNNTVFSITSIFIGWKGSSFLIAMGNTFIQHLTLPSRASCAVTCTYIITSILQILELKINSLPNYTDYATVTVI